MVDADLIQPPVSVEALADWLGEPINEEADMKAAKEKIRYAFVLVNEQTDQDMAYWDDKLPEAVRSVVLQVAGRGYSNPESWGNERVDDWGGGQRPVEEQGMYLTATEKRILSKFAKRSLFGIGVLDTYRDGPGTTVPPWFDPVTGGIPDWRG